jgi:hypothetical protein
MFMRDSGDSSVLKSLAVAFGDGLAFGVGMKLTQNAKRQSFAPAVAAPSEAGAILDRLDQIEQRMRLIESTPAGFDQKTLDALTGALEARLNEHTSQVERRLADMEARILMETRALEQQDRGLAARMEQDLQGLKAQVVALNREFAGQVGRIVAEQVAAEVQARTAGLEIKLRTQAMDLADDAVQERLAPMRLEMAAKDREIAELRQKVAATDSTVFDFVFAMGEMCRQAAGRLSPPAAPGATAVAEPAPPPAPEASPAETAAPDTGPAEIAAEDRGADLRDHFDNPVGAPAPSFSELRKPPGFWRMPMVSSFVALAASLAMLRFF